MYPQCNIKHSKNHVISLLIMIFISLVYASEGDLNINMNDGDDDYFNMILNIQEYYKIHSVYIVYTNISKNHSLKIKILHYLNKFSSKEIFSQALDLPVLNAKYNGTFLRSSQQIFVVFIENEDDLQRFESFTKWHNLSFHNWLLIFGGPPTKVLIDYCQNPDKNWLNLDFNYHMLVKCYNDPIIKEWYSTKSREKIIVNDLMEWKPQDGLLLKTKVYFYQRRHSFYEADLRVAPVQEHIQPLIMTPDKKIQNMGAYQKLIFELINDMNFNITLLPPVKTYGQFNKTTQKWMGMLGEIEAGNVELPFSEFAIVIERLDSFEYTWPLYMTRNMLYFQDPGITAVGWNAYIKGFRRDVWITFAVFLIVVPIILTWIKTRIEKQSHFAENFLAILGIYCQQGVPVVLSSSSWKIFVIFLFLSQLVYFASYSAFLISYLTTLSTTLPFYTLEEFVKDGSYKFTTVQNSGEEILFLTTKDPLLLKMRNMMKPHNEAPVDNIEALKQMCEVEKLAFYTTDIKPKKIQTPNSCKYVGILGDGKRYIGLPLVKHHPLINFLNYNILRFTEHGILKRLLNMYSKNSDDFPPEFNAVDFRDIAPALTIIAFGICMSIFVLLLELVYFKGRQAYANNVRSRRIPLHKRTTF